MKTGVPAKDAKYSTHQDYNMKAGCPTSKGAKSIAPAAYSPKTKLLYVPLNYMCMTFESVESKYFSGRPWVGATTSEFQGPLTSNELQNREEISGGFAAYNPITNKVAWYNKERLPILSGVLATTSNLVFYSTLDRWFKAVDAKTGQELWKFQVASGVVGNAYTYGHKGKQYVGVPSGLGGWAGNHVANSMYWESQSNALSYSPLDGFSIRLLQSNTAPSGGALNIFSL